MRGKTLIAALEREGFLIARRSPPFVWMVRDDRKVLIDEGAELPEADARSILDEARAERGTPSTSG